LGLAGNYFRYRIFLNIDFLFGSIFAMLALQFFGLGRGVVAAALIAGYTYILWNHPYAIIILTAEVATVGWLISRRKIGVVLADLLYWLIIGMPCVYLFYRGIMHAPSSSVYLTMTKQAINGLTNVLIARLIYTSYSLRTKTSLTSYHEIVYNLLTSFVLFPALIFLMISSKADYAEVVLKLKNSLAENTVHEHLILDQWAIDRKSVITNLARLAATETYQQMQTHLEQAVKSDNNFLRIALLDDKATTKAFFPLVDELGKSNIGKNFADRPYIPVLKQTLMPMLSEVVMGRLPPSKPIVTMLAPIVVKGEYNGYLAGVLNLEHINNHLNKRMSMNGILYTLLDRNRNVLMTNRADQKVMTPFDRGQGTFDTLDDRIKLWTQTLPPNIPMSERWKKSFYVVESGIGGQDEWTLILEQPIAPFQEAIFEKYTDRMALLLALLVGVMVLAEIISRTTVRSLERLNQITRHLPVQLMNNATIEWPASGIFEVNYQIHNFRETATALGNQFREIQLINMTLEKRVEERTKALIESELFFKESQRAAFIGSYKISFITGYWDSSEVLDSILGIDKGYVRNVQNLFELVHPDDREMMIQLLNNGFDLKLKSLAKEFRIVSKKCGAIRWVAGSGEATYDSAGKINYLIGTIQDIHERKLEQEKLFKSENIISQLLQSTDQGIYGVDLNGMCTFINNAGLNMIGYELEDCLGNNIHKLIHHTNSDGLPYPGEGCPVVLASIHGEGFRHDNEVMWRRDGTQFPVEYSSHPIIEKGTIVGAVVAFSDISERKRQEKEKQVLEQQFQEAQKYECFGVLASGIAHDFNNILAIIMGQSSLVKMDPYNVLRYASEVEKAVSRGAELCRQLLTYSGKVNIKKSRIDMAELTEEMVNLLKATLKHNIEIQFDNSSDLPMVYGDASQIRQVVMNLIINAVEAIGSNNGIIKVLLSDEIITEHTLVKGIQFNNIEPGRYISLEVIDNGCGMNEETMQRIFEPFYTTKSTGRGLGTSAIYGTVKSHKGALILDSLPKTGTTFKILLPYKNSTDMTDGVPRSDKLKILKGSGTILLVDDEEAILLSTSYMLKKLGFTVIEAQNGKQALELSRQTIADLVLVLTDIGMPEMNGQELIYELKKVHPRLPIVISSGYGDSSLRTQIDVSGLDLAGSLNKPYSFEELQAVIRGAVKSAEAPVGTACQTAAP